MNMKDALEKYDWVNDYMWNAVAIDTDKYTAETALRDSGGYFIEYFARFKGSISNSGLYVYWRFKCSSNCA